MPLFSRVSTVTMKTQTYKPMPIPALPASTGPITDDNDSLKRRLQPLLSGFQSDMGYDGICPGSELQVLLKAMREQAALIGISYPEGSVSWYAFKVGLCYAHVSLDTPKLLHS